MGCRHLWRHAGSLDRAICSRCGAEAYRDEQDPDGRWHLLQVALRRALYPVK